MEVILALILTFGLGAFFDTGSDDLSDDRIDPKEPVDPDTPIMGTDGDDTAVLGGGADVYDGGAGNDSIDGGAGFDTLSGGDARDVIEGDFGKDYIYGGNGYDNLSGGGWKDTIFGGYGFDDIYGGSSNDILNGGNGKDLIEGGTGNDTLNGGSWVDGLFGGEGNDLLRGGNGTDFVSGDAGNDLVRGGNGSDLVLGGAGSDSVFGGDGDDIISASGLFSRALNSDDYDDARDETLPNDEDGDPFFVGWGLSGVDTDTDADMLSGGAGDDTIYIGNNDVARGGDGDDEFIVGDWMEDGALSEITDFDSTEYIIVVALSTETAGVEVTTSATDEGIGQIFIDGVLVSSVKGDFDRFDGFDADVITASYTPIPAPADPVATG